MLEHCFDLSYFEKIRQYKTDDARNGLGGYTVYKVWNRGHGLLELFRFYKDEKIVLINEPLYNKADERHLIEFFKQSGLSGYTYRKVYYDYPVYYNNSFNLNLK